MSYVDNFEPEDEFVNSDLPNFRFHSNKFDDLGDAPSGASDADKGLRHSQDAYLSEQSNSQSLSAIIKEFVTLFHRFVKEQNVYEIHSIYEHTFNKLTDRYFKNTTWPSVDVVRPMIEADSDPFFFVLYKELYYRHIYSKLQPTIEQRVESWKNYKDLFDHLLNATSEPGVNLPNQWLWDIIDEFIYQFQSFLQYRSKLKNKAPEEITLLKENPEVWNILGVLKYLDALIAKSNIIHTLEQEKQGEHVEEPATGHTFATHPVYKTLGYFSIIGLLRVHCLLGDYHLALKVLEPIDINKKGLFSRVTACHITLFYYVGFAYMMMRRYVDTIKTFSTILLYLNRTKQYHTRSYQYEQIVKKNEQMYALLAIAVSLCPQRIDENVHIVLREKYADKIVKLQRGDEGVFEELFSYACPKFIIPSPPNYDDESSTNFSQEALRQQLNLFLLEVKQQSLLPTIRSYLKLYSTIGVNKLATFNDMNEAQFRTQLLCFKQKTRNLVWSGGPALSGKWASSSDVDFYVEQDMIHIVDSKVTRRYSDFFIRHINKFDEIVRDVSGR